jgi:2-keto-myo-inositol isomerase
MTMRFALNRTCAPQLPLADFIDLAGAVGVTAVEIRNDIAGREFADGTPAAQVRAQLEAAGLAVASVNALQRFNDWTLDRATEATALIAYAAALGAPGVVLCPVHDPDHGWTEAEALRNLRQGLRHLAPILRDHGLIGYVEPLGMPGSTLTRQDVAVAAVTDIDGWDTYQLCYDTFQFFRCGDSRLFPDRIGLAHMSGISRTDLAPGALVEPDRGLIFAGDRVGNVAQLQALQAAGFAGYVSMEPFSPRVQSDPQLADHLRRSLEYVGAMLDAAPGTAPGAL